jgi:diacylglycerol kinase family enzyme
MMESGSAEILLVANPTSGRGRAGRWVERARALLTGEQLAHHVVVKRGEAGELLARERGRFGEYWIFGGDGTLNDLSQHLVEVAPARVAIFPAGTGNVVARDLGVPLHFEGAWRAARGTSLRPFDLLRINDRRAAFMVSAGLDAELAHQVASARTGPMRRMDWVRAALSAPRSAQEARVRAIADGKDLGEARYAAVFNCGLYAGGFRVCPSARFDDGRLELLLLREPIRPRWLRVVWAALRHRPESLPDATLVSAKSIELRGVERSQVDGDPGPAGDLKIAVEPGALLVRAAAVSSGRSPTPG